MEVFSVFILMLSFLSMVKKEVIENAASIFYNACNNESVCQILVMIFILIGQEESDSSPINIFHYQIEIISNIISIINPLK